MTHLLSKSAKQNDEYNSKKEKKKKNGKYNLLPLQVPVSLDYKRDCYIHFKILQLHKITWHFFTAGAKTKIRFELNFLLLCTVVYEFLSRCQRQEQQQRQLQSRSRSNRGAVIIRTDSLSHSGEREE